MLPKTFISLSCAGVMCYDDACHLKKYAQNPIRNELTEVAKRLNNITMVCDIFHFRNHVDSWCKKNCNPHTCSELEVRAIWGYLQYYSFFNFGSVPRICKVNGGRGSKITEKNFHIHIFFSGRGPEKFGPRFLDIRKKNLEVLKHIKPWIPREFWFTKW